MKLAITGGTGFVGRHLAERFEPGNVVVVSRRTGVDVDDVDALAAAFEGCEVVAHFAGINREIGAQTYERVHVQGTAGVIHAAQRAGVRKIVFASFLRARSNCGSPYHESKWAAEELVRGSGLDYTILKPGIIYGRGDHFVDHVSRTLFTIPLFATVGLRDRPVSPIPIAEFTDIAVAAIKGRMPRETVAVVGAEELTMREAVRRVARAAGRRVWVLPAPVWSLSALAQLSEWTMKVPLVAKAQVRMLADGVTEAWGEVAGVPTGLAPSIHFTDEQLRLALPEPGRFGLHDLLLRR